MITRTKLVTVILMVVFLLSALILIMKFSESFDDIEKAAPCATQIKVHGTLSGLTNEYAANDIKCPTNFIKKEVTNDEAQALIAEQMATCWAMWGRGNLTLFSDEEGVYCHLCSHMTLSGVNEVSGFSEYISNHEVKKGITYAEYLAGVKDEDFYKKDELLALSTETIPLDKPLAVMFYYKKGSTIVEDIRRTLLGNPILGVTGGILAGGAVVASLGGGGILITAGAATGGVSGGIGSIAVRPDSHIMSGILVRPLTADDIKKIGCTYAPVQQKS